MCSQKSLLKLKNNTFRARALSSSETVVVLRAPHRRAPRECVKRARGRRRDTQAHLRDASHPPPRHHARGWCVCPPPLSRISLILSPQRHPLRSHDKNNHHGDKQHHHRRWCLPGSSEHHDSSAPHLFTSAVHLGLRERGQLRVLRRLGPRDSHLLARLRVHGELPAGSLRRRAQQDAHLLWSPATAKLGEEKKERKTKKNNNNLLFPPCAPTVRFLLAPSSPSTHPSALGT